MSRGSTLTLRAPLQGRAAGQRSVTTIPTGAEITVQRSVNTRQVEIADVSSLGYFRAYVVNAVSLALALRD